MFFDGIVQAPADPVFGLLGAFQSDSRSKKISLMVGTYKDKNLKNVNLPSVERAKLELGAADYLPIDGLAQFHRGIGEVCFGKKLWEGNQARIFSAQGVGGTGSLRVGAELLAQEVGREIWIPQPTWPNHRMIFERAGLKVGTLPYYDSKMHAFDRETYFASLLSLPERSIVLMHAVCHNPTGSDPTIDDWKKISKICRERSLFPFFDLAYQGFGAGMEEDAAAVRLFLEEEHEFMVAYSCSKNFGLYCQRTGALFVVGPNEPAQVKIGSQVKRIIRATYSNPPAFGARIAATILSNPSSKAEWIGDVKSMRDRIQLMRETLVNAIRSRSKQVDFQFVLQHKGMFSYLDLSAEQVKRLKEEFAIYTLESGRINVAGLNDENLPYFVDSLLRVCEP